MIKCPSCSREILDDSRLCSYCGAPVEAGVGIPTVTAPRELANRAVQPAPTGSSSDSIDQARFTPGTMLTERYRIVGLLGKGGMGEVYRAKDTRLDREVAIKVLADTFARDPERVARFQREAKVLASLNHPNIAAIHGFEESDGKRFLVLELVEGDTLAERLRGGAVPVDESLAICKQMAEALEAAHERGVIHRDLSQPTLRSRQTARSKSWTLDWPRT